MRSAQIAKLMGCSQKVVNDAYERGDLKGWRVGNGPRNFAYVDVIAFFEANDVPLSALRAEFGEPLTEAEFLAFYGMDARNTVDEAFLILLPTHDPMQLASNYLRCAASFNPNLKAAARGLLCSK